jgi:hypothetical protein
LNYQDYVKLRPSDKDFKVALLRPDDEGKLVLKDATVPAGQPKVQLLDLTESE